MPIDSLAVGLDIGGTNIRAALVNPHGEILFNLSAPTPKNTEAMEAKIAELVAELQRGYEVDAVGVAVAGFLDPDCEIVRFAPHLPWRYARVREKLEQRLGLPVRLEHDANAAAWGEYRFGSAQHSQDWVFLAIGTGIGAALIAEGNIYRGAFGTAPEFGHICVVPNGRPCSCGKRGCLERYCSGTGLVETAIEFAASEGFPRRGLAEILRNSPDSVTGPTITKAARAGDPLAVAVLADFTKWLGEALSIIADTLDPALIVLGGGVSQEHDLFLPLAVEHFSHRIVGAGYRPLAQVIPATLSSRAGMIGVAELARCGRSTWGIEEEIVTG